MKFQSNSEIAGSPRNSFRASLKEKIRGGRALNVLGAFTGYRKLSNSEYRSIILGSQTTRHKFRGQKGNSPDLKLRSPNVDYVEKDVELHRQLGCWLRSSHSFKECVIAH